MDTIVLMSDAKVAAVPVRECGESLVDVRRDASLLTRVRPDDEPAAYFVREGVLDRLIAAQTSLPAGTRLLLVEGYRPLALQQHYFEEYADLLRAENPGWADEQIFMAASRFVSPPEIAPHSAGAAVDLTLVDANGRELDLGTPIDASPEESAGACYTAADNISLEARANREILSAALTGAEMVNYPTEWWHWSYGDRYWALIAQTTAIYGPCAMPPATG